MMLSAISALLLTSCIEYSHYNGAVEAVSPVPPDHFDLSRNWIGRETTPTGMPAVDSLQPTLCWKSTDSGASKFDIIVYQGVPKPVRGFNGGRDPVYYVPGAQVYYREGIEGGSHRLEQPLSPQTVYVWSVRTRSGSNVGSWATYDFHSTRGGIGATQSASGKGLWWPFRTQ